MQAPAMTSRNTEPLVGLTALPYVAFEPRIDGLYRAILDSLEEGVYFVDRDRKIVYWNHAAEVISGYRAEEVMGRRCADGILRHCTADGNVLCGAGCPLQSTMLDGKALEADVFLHHKKGHRLPVNVRSTAVRDDDGRIVGSVEIFSDRSRKIVAFEQAKELNRLAFIDELTQVGNRRSVDARLRELFSDPVGMGMPAGVLFVDIDHFKRFNDEHGHDTGDLVLHAVATTLGSNLRGYDFVGRWGGEEFVVVTAASSLSDLEQLAERLRLLVEQTDLEIDGTKLSVTVSIGGSLAKTSDDPRALVARADSHLYESKQNGRNRSTVR